LLAREYGFRTWAELAEATDQAKDTHYSRLPPELPWKRAEAAIRAGDADTLSSLLQQHPGLESEFPGETLLGAAAQPEAGRVPREVVDVLIESGSALDDPLNYAACFNKTEMVGWLLDAGADPSAAAGISALQSAAYHGSREAADILVSRTGIIPGVFYLACAAGDTMQMAKWFDATGQLLRQALRERPDFLDVGWPGRAILPDPDDAMAEGLALAAQLGLEGPDDARCLRLPQLQLQPGGTQCPRPPSQAQSRATSSVRRITAACGSPLTRDSSSRTISNEMQVPANCPVAPNCHHRVNARMTIYYVPGFLAGRRAAPRRTGKGSRGSRRRMCRANTLLNSWGYLAANSTRTPCRPISVSGGAAAVTEKLNAVHEDGALQVS
jgi:hypothetical protein